MKTQRHEVTQETRADGTILLRSARPLGPFAEKTGDWLHRWAADAPKRVFIAERSGAGWREVTYAEALEAAQKIGAALLARGMGAETPILIMSGNGVDHALLTLGAQYVGVPTVPVAEQYALIPAAHPRLAHAVELTKPKMAYAVDAEKYAAAFALDCLQGVEIVASTGAEAAGATPFDAILAGDGPDVAAAHHAVGPETVAKILMTSGSTSLPKGVLTTHRMMCANQAQIGEALSFLSARPPRILDWLPWNHVFGGSHNFNMMLGHGGSLYIDDGKPLKGLFDRSIENLSMIAGTVSFNVPVGFAMLLEAFAADDALGKKFFSELDMILYAGASLPQEVWAGIEDLALKHRGEKPLITSSWGLTETAPACTLQHEPTDRSGVIGAPLAGVTVKLIPDDAGRFEARVAGPNVMTGYFDAPDKTAAAFDEDGFFITGDAVRFVDPGDINLGLKFDGRVSEEFKLLTGVWVRAGELRLSLLGELAPLVADLVLTGADRNEIGLMLFPNMAELTRLGGGDPDAGALRAPAMMEEIRARLAKRAEGASSSTRVARAILLADAPSMPDGEMTAKGNLNFKAVLTRRADLLDRLYAEDDPAVIRV